MVCGVEFMIKILLVDDEREEREGISFYFKNLSIL